MSVITYRIVRHDGGWAYEVNGTFSETFPTRDAARRAARRAACGQTLRVGTVPIDYEDEQTAGHYELSCGNAGSKARVGH